MAKTLILNQADLRACVGLDSASLAVVENAFRLLATAAVAMPPILRLDVPEHNGEVDVKTAYLPGVAHFAIKVSPGFFDNPKLGLPSLNGLMMLFSAQTGLADALLLDNGYLTAVRTAAAGAVAARWLAREDAGVVAILGAGEQARLQLQALRLVREVREVRIWARDPAKARAMAAELEDARAVDSVDAALEGADIAVSTTPSREPLIQPRHLRPGLHITAMGSDQAGKNEIDPRALSMAQAYICDSARQCEVSGELEAALAARLWDRGTPPELGAVITGAAKGRQSEDDITICDLTGTGAQDTAIANFVHARAAARGLGLSYEA